MSVIINEQPMIRRKKACDLCFTKKIKCDQREPRCSNCILYKAECTQAIIRRRTNPPKPRPVRRHRGVHGVDALLASSPISPGTSITNPLVLSNTQTQSNTLVPPISVLGSIGDSITGTAEIDSEGWTFDPLCPSLYNGPPDNCLGLPSLDEIMPILDHYFRNVNPSTLLFDEASFMRKVTRWYSLKPKRDTATWASILVVVALGLQTLISEMNFPFSIIERKNLMNFCMRNAQSVLPELIMRDEDLMGVQVLTALATLFQNSFDVRPAGILIGMAVRLAQRLQLHLEDTAELFNADEARERSNVFWATYMVDKALCLKGKTPSTISDTDVSIPLPPHEIVSKAGIIQTECGQASLNLFRHGVELAYIEGKVNDQLYSRRSARLETSERQRRLDKLREMLSQWYARIPVAFHLENVFHNLGGAKLVQITHLYQGYLLALVTVNGIWSGRAEWMQKVTSLSRAAIDNITVSLHGPKVATCLQKQIPPSMDAWKHCVGVSRAFMRLFQQTPRSPCLVWQSGCAHFSTIINVLSNIVTCPGHVFQFQDLQLATSSIELHKQLLASGHSEVHESLYYIIEDLRGKAAEVVGGGSEQFGGVEDMLATPGHTRDQYLFSGQNTFPELETGEGLHLNSLDFCDALASDQEFEDFSFLDN